MDGSVIQGILFKYGMIRKSIRKNAKYLLMHLFFTHTHNYNLITFVHKKNILGSDNITISKLNLV